MHVFEAITADEVWQMALSVLNENHGAPSQASRGGPTRELLHAVFSVTDPLQRWVVCREPPLNPAFALAEVVWILNGSNDSAFLNTWNSQLPKYAGSGSTYHGAYGHRLRRHLKLDQLYRAYQVLRSNPDSRQVVLQIWDSRVDLPDENGRPVDPDIPCNIMSLLKVRDNKLEWMQIMRSNDLYLGTPYNFNQFMALQEVMAGWLGIEPGSYVHISDSLHLYHRNIDNGIDVTDLVVEENTDSMALPYDESTRILSVLYDRILCLASPELRSDDLGGVVTEVNLPEAYWNIFLIIAAEAARKRKWFELAKQIEAQCSNPVLRQVLVRWWSRFASSTGAHLLSPN